MTWVLLIPELHFLFMAAVFFCLSLLGPPDPRRDHRIALFLTAVGAILSLLAVRMEGMPFLGIYRVDLFSQIFKAMLAVGSFLVVYLCSELKGIPEDRHSEFYFLMSICTMAMMLLVSSVELVTIYVTLELTSYSLYVLVPLRKGYGIHVEAGIKYFLAGAATSGVTLFGMACLYGATHTTFLDELARVLPGVIDTPMACIGLLFALSGFFFKLAVFPFHIWAPTVYQGAANQVTAYIATGTKVAGMAILTRLVSPAGGGHIFLADVLVALSLASMTFGNLVAIMQKDMKRLLAYSAIAHGGYVLMGILSMNESGYAGVIFYAGAYLVMTYTCFFVVVKVASDGGNLQIAQLAGLHQRSPLLAMALLTGVFSLGGIPPTMGFTAKFLVFTAAMKQGHFTLVLMGMINVVVSLYYYALLVKAAYLTEPSGTLPPIVLTPFSRILAALMVAGIVIGGIFPRPLYEAARAAARLLM